MRDFRRPSDLKARLEQGQLRTMLNLGCYYYYHFYYYYNYYFINMIIIIMILLNDKSKKLEGHAMQMERVLKPCKGSIWSVEEYNSLAAIFSFAFCELAGKTFRASYSKCLRQIGSRAIETFQ